MKYLAALLFIWVTLQAKAQEEDIDPNKRHVAGIKYNLSIGNIVAYSEESYNKSLFYNLVPLELQYTYFISGRLSVHGGILSGTYEDKDYDNNLYRSFKHKIDYRGIKAGLGLQTSRTLGRSVVHYTLAFCSATEYLRIILRDPYVGWSSYNDVIEKRTNYFFAEIGQQHQFALHKKGNIRLSVDYGCYINLYLEPNRFNLNKEKHTAVPSIGTLRLLCPYLSLGMAYGFNTGQ